MSDWNPAAFNWRVAFTNPTFSPRPVVIFVFGLAVGLSIPVAWWIGAVLLVALIFLVLVEYAWALGSSLGRERKRQIAYRKSGHRSTEG